MTWEETKAALMAQCAARLAAPEIARLITQAAASGGTVEVVVSSIEVTLRAKGGAA